MTDLVIEHLKRIQADLAELKRDMREVKGTCSTTLGIVGELVKSEAREQGRFAELEVRIERIERRLDIHGEP
jgi:predicted nuclease with TOPRIM domain